MDPSVGLAIQCIGIVLVTVLTFFMRYSIRNASLKYWTIAWCCLSLSLCSLFIALHISEQKNFFYSLYFLGQYAFGLMFVAGCRHYSTGRRLRKSDGYLLLAAVTIAAVLPLVSDDFNDLFIIQATIIALLFAAAVFALRPAVAGNEVSQGLRVTRIALMLLTIDFLLYVPIFSARKGLWGVWVPAGYLKYTSIVDLILEILLGFGVVMVLMEGVRREVEAANRKLVEAHDKLKLLAQMDPLTEALNRHAFHSLLDRGESSSTPDIFGCVAVIDIDNLKTINDSLGHGEGDKAIRATARAVRSIVRADDMLFRWGGDEFLVLMFKLEQSEAFRRMQSLNEILERSDSQWTVALGKLSVSFGVAGFESLGQLSAAIEQADKSMYERRQEVRRAGELQLVG
jgi:diguanylate cyclase (GGDEF)-like protein